MQPSLFDAVVDDPRPPDQAARDFAVDPANDVVLEASAGTGKTRVLVDRYVRLIDAGVDPRHILAVTFTRKAAAEMRDRILAALRQRAADDARLAERWRELRERIGDIQISTIDAFCFSLLREFPLEAGVDPAFEIADETEMARFGREALDLTLRAARGLITADENVRLLFARVKLGPLRDAVQSLLDRRHVALPAVGRFVAQRVRFSSSAEAGAAFVQRLNDLFATSTHARAILGDGPAEAPEFQWLLGDLQHLADFPGRDPGRVQQLQRRLQRYFLTEAGKPRAQAARRFSKDAFTSADAKRRHDAALKAIAPHVSAELDTLVDDVRGLLARGLHKILAIAAGRYEDLLDEHAVLDFAGMLAKAVALLSRQEEFARSRLKLQSRYHHVLVDEFQDTNRLQWELVEKLIDAWGEGEGAQDAPTSIFVVGDRKQSIYRFRHAEVTLLDEVARKVAALRPGRTVRQAITHSFRAVPELLAFVNALSAEVLGTDDLDERFTYGDTDRFPVPDTGPGARRDGIPVLGLIAEPSMDACAQAVAAEVARLLDGAMVRDPHGVRPARPDDIAILFRARTGHQFFEAALEARGIRTYVYKGLGFFDAPEVQDLQALLRYLAQPDSNLRAAEFLRSRLVRVSDVGLARLARAPEGDASGRARGPALAEALRSPGIDLAPFGLDAGDRALLTHLRAAVARWLRLADRVSPSLLLDTILHESAYAFELGGRRLGQARENIKKVRALVRRIENRGYATLGRIAEYFETLRAGDESHAIVEAVGCVNLMTVHAAKGLEFPIVFVVNLHVPGRGRSSAFSVIERGPDGEPEVAFGSSDATRLEDLREREELRRLLYVSVTRARDRLYLAAELDETRGRLQRGARSLAALLPPALGDLFNAANPGGEVEWTSASGTFAFRICRPAPDFASPAAALDREPVLRPDVTPVLACDPVVMAATAADAAGTASQAVDEPAESPSDRLLGTLVHRLFQRQLDVNLSQSAIADLVPALLRSAESVDVADEKALSEAVASTYYRLRQRDDVAAVLAQGRCHYEVPFSFQPADVSGAVVRGRIDCLVERAEGNFTIVEFKTGRPRPEHESQVAVYRAALSAAMPGREIETRVLYP
jgi:ATP-dependent helicase/nuclease subunit A